MILECFFDGGNQSDSRIYDYVSLAVVAGTFREWKPFNREWKRNLIRHGAPWLHTTDAVTGNYPYSKDKGWNRKKIDSFLLSCVKIVNKHIARPLHDDYLGKAGILPYVVTINLKDYVQALSEAEGVPNSANEVLALDTVNACMSFGKDYIGANKFRLVYDQNEPFRGHIVDRRKSQRALKAYPVLEEIVEIKEDDSRLVPALQVADLFAYCYSHKRDAGSKPKWEEKVLKIPLNEGYGDKSRLMKPIPKTVEVVRSLKLPKRAKTR